MDEHCHETLLELERAAWRALSSDGGAAATFLRLGAERDGVHYEALFNSTDVQCGDGWRLALHQQTPI